MTEIDPVNEWKSSLGSTPLPLPNTLLPEWFKRSEVSKLKPSNKKLPSNSKFPPICALLLTSKADAEINPDAEMFPVAVMSANLTEDPVVKPPREAVNELLAEL